MSNSDELLQRYAELKQQIAKLESELEDIKEAVFQSVDSSGGEFTGDSWVVRSQKRPRYRFSPAYDEKNQELKDLKKSEIENGIATIDGYSEFVTIRFKD